MKTIRGITYHYKNNRIGATPAYWDYEKQDNIAVKQIKQIAKLKGINQKDIKIKTHFMPGEMVKGQYFDYVNYKMKLTLKRKVIEEKRYSDIKQYNRYCLSPKSL